MAHDSIAQIAAFGRTDHPWQLVAPGTGRTDPLDIAKAILGEAKLIDQSFADALKAIDANADLSDQGRRNHRATAARKRMEDLAKLRAELAKVSKARDEARKRDDKAGESDKLLRELRAAEIRRYVHERTSGDQLNVCQVVLDAFEANDLDLIEAVLDAPASWPGRPDPGDIEDFRGRLLEAVDPRKSEDLRLLHAAYTDTDNMLTTVEGTLAEHVPAGDDVTTQAEGEAA